MKPASGSQLPRLHAKTRYSIRVSASLDEKKSGRSEAR
jgi:hypothetical protein